AARRRRRDRQFAMASDGNEPRAYPAYTQCGRGAHARAVDRGLGCRRGGVDRPGAASARAAHGRRVARAGAAEWELANVIAPAAVEWRDIERELRTAAVDVLSVGGAGEGPGAGAAAAHGQGQVARAAVEAARAAAQASGRARLGASERVASGAATAQGRVDARAAVAVEQAR